MARLSRDSWVDAAYQAFNDHGISAIAVEPIARSIGSTKGSFYWHFADRQALVDAVLERWEQLETEQLIDQVDAIDGTPTERLGALFELVAHRTGERRGERTLYADAAAFDVHGVVTRVTERRVSYVAQILIECGVEPEEARRRATIVVSAVIGFAPLIAGGWHPTADPRPLTDTLKSMALGGV